MVRVMIRVRVRSQEALGTEPTTLVLSPRRGEWCPQGRVSVRTSLGFQGRTNVRVTLRVCLRIRLVQLQSRF